MFSAELRMAVSLLDSRRQVFRILEITRRLPMRVSLFFIARHAELLQDGSIAAHGIGIDCVQVKELPTIPSPLFLVLNLRFPADAPGTQTFTLQLVTPENQTQFLVKDATLDVPPNPEDPAGDKGAGLLANLKLTLKSPGWHQLSLVVDGEEIGAIPFLVKLTSQAKAETVIQ